MPTLLLVVHLLLLAATPYRSTACAVLGPECWPVQRWGSGPAPAPTPHLRLSTRPTLASIRRSTQVDGRRSMDLTPLAHGAAPVSPCSLSYTGRSVTCLHSRAGESPFSAALCPPPPDTITAPFHHPKRHHHLPPLSQRDKLSSYTSPTLPYAGRNTALCRCRMGLLRQRCTLLAALPRHPLQPLAATFLTQNHRMPVVAGAGSVPMCWLA